MRGSDVDASDPLYFWPQGKTVLAKKKTKEKRSLRIPRFERWAEDHTIRLVFGFTFILFSLFLLGAIVSYLLNWREDLSEVSGSLWTLISNSDYQVENIFGKLGAAFGHVLVYKGFGLASLIWVFISARLGLLIAVDYKKNFGRHLRYSLYGLFWFCLILAAIQTRGEGLWSGSGGRNIYLRIQAQIGTPGVWMLLIGSLLIFISLHFKLTPARIGELWAKFKSLFPHRTEATENEENVDDKIEQENISSEESESQLEWSDVVEKKEVDSAPKSLESELEIEVNTEEIEEPIIKSAEKSAQEQPKEEEVELMVEEVEEEAELDAKAHKKLLKEVGFYDPKLDLSSFKMPTLDLMIDYGSSNITIDQEELEGNKNRIVETLAHYKIEIAKIKATIGPTVTLYEIVPAPGVRISKIKNLEDDIALSLSAEGIRIIAPIPGKGTIGIEVPNANPKMVSMRAVLASEKFQKSDYALPIVMGKTISNETYVTDLAKMPHLLMAGATGQGKSVGLNVILTSILYKKHPSEVKFVLVDPKKVELTLFNIIERHYLAEMPGNGEAIITDTKKVVYTLNSLCVEMDQRYELLKNAMVRNIKEYNVKFKERRLNPEEGHRYLPYIVLVVDEFADLIMTAGKEVETPIARLAQLARAIGIHLIIATQRPSVNVITGIIKANFPARIAFRVTSKIDSRTILDAGGAERLIGKGDMLISMGSEPIRLQCAFVDTPEIEKLVEYIGHQRGYTEAYQLPEFEGEESSGVSDISPEDRDVMFEDAARILVIHQQGSASLLQRKLKLGYNRAGRIIDQLEAAGIIGPFEGSKARQVLVSDEASLEQILNKDK